MYVVYRKGVFFFKTIIILEVFSFFSVKKKMQNLNSWNKIFVFVGVCIIQRSVVHLWDIRRVLSGLCLKIIIGIHSRATELNDYFQRTRRFIDESRIFWVTCFRTRVLGIIIHCVCVSMLKYFTPYTLCPIRNEYSKYLCFIDWNFDFWCPIVFSFNSVFIN